MTDDLAISVHGLTKSFGDRHAVDNLTFDLQRSNVTGFVGPNGAGKSTTIRMLLGLVRPSAGTTHFRAQNHAVLSHRPAAPRPQRCVT